jgi:hypothetical protein
MGAIFMPNVKIEDILKVTNDYDRYKEFYHPSVVESKTLARNGADDRFAMLLMNRAFFLKTALETEYQASSVRLDDRRFYSTSRTTRVQEIQAYGQPDEYYVTEGEGNGFMWKVSSISRIQQCERGVYIGDRSHCAEPANSVRLALRDGSNRAPCVAQFAGYLAFLTKSIDSN